MNTQDTQLDKIRSTWRFDLNEIIQSCAGIYPTESTTALTDAFMWCYHPDHPVAFDEFCNRVHYAPNTVYKIFTGRYKGEGDKLLPPPKKLIDSIRHFLAIEKERLPGGRTEFIKTPTVQKIWMACDFARESQTPVLVWGKSQLGKTWALREYAEKQEKTIYCSMESGLTFTALVKHLAEALGCKSEKQSELREEIKKALRPDMVLILDEMHLLCHTLHGVNFFKCIEFIRRLGDNSGAGMVLCGTELFLNRLRAGEHGAMEQIMRRGVHRFQLPDLPTVKDVQMVIETSGLKWASVSESVTVKSVSENPRTLLRTLAKRDGLKSITERIRYARRLASKRNAESLTWEHFVEAHLIIASQSEKDEKGGW